jgi:hypothetical protein
LQIFLKHIAMKSTKKETSKTGYGNRRNGSKSNAENKLPDKSRREMTGESGTRKGGGDQKGGGTGGNRAGTSAGNKGGN